VKLFIWTGDGVLTDYTNGMICAIAPDLESALKAIEVSCNYCSGAFPPSPTEVIDIGPDTPSKAWTYWGGG